MVNSPVCHRHRHPFGCVRQRRAKAPFFLAKPVHTPARTRPRERARRRRNPSSCRRVAPRHCTAPHLGIAHTLTSRSTASSAPCPPSGISVSRPPLDLVAMGRHRPRPLFSLPYQCPSTSFHAPFLALSNRTDTRARARDAGVARGNSPLLTILTTSFRPSKSQKQGGYMTIFMHIFNTNKVPRVVLVFLLTNMHLG
jgi:hypothetical protein